jgi:hypothetical protein
LTVGDEYFAAMQRVADEMCVDRYGNNAAAEWDGGLGVLSRLYPPGELEQAEGRYGVTVIAMDVLIYRSERAAGFGGAVKLIW